MVSRHRERILLIYCLRKTFYRTAVLFLFVVELMPPRGIVFEETCEPSLYAGSPFFAAFGFEDKVILPRKFDKFHLPTEYL